MSLKNIEYNGLEKKFVEINEGENSVSFKLQKGPRKIHGSNGCDVDEIIYFAYILLRKYNEELYDMQSEVALKSLKEAVYYLGRRRGLRMSQGVEGTLEKHKGSTDDSMDEPSGKSDFLCTKTEGEALPKKKKKIAKKKKKTIKKTEEENE